MAEKKIKLRDRTLKNDIKFKAPFSYRELRIIGWVFIVLAQIAVILNLNSKINPASAPFLNGWSNFFQSLSYFSLPLFLVANMACIIQKRDNFKNMLLFYGGAALGMYLLGNFVVFHYGRGIMNSISPTSWGEAADLFGLLLPALGKNGYVFNIFIDLFLCSLMYFFLYYDPKKYFKDKKKIWFRLMVLLPIFYEIGSMVIKFRITFYYMTIPSYVFFFLTSKPPFMLLAFLLLILLFKIDERKHIKKLNKSEKELKEHKKTNAHSLLVSIQMSIIFIIVTILDAIFSSIIFASVAVNMHALEDQALLSAIGKQLSNIGFFGSATLVILIPVFLLFSYKKEPKNKEIDKFIPIVGIGLILFVYVEGIFQTITHQLPIIIEKIKNIFSGGGDTPPEEGEGEELIRRIVHFIRSLR